MKSKAAGVCGLFWFYRLDFVASDPNHTEVLGIHADVEFANA